LSDKGSNLPYLPSLRLVWVSC